jgi:hypothetical protein
MVSERTLYRLRPVSPWLQIGCVTLLAWLATATLAVRPALACVGDCHQDGAVTIDEILTMVNIALGSLPVQQCMAGDVDGDGAVTVDEIVAAVNAALTGCPPAPTPTPAGLDVSGHWTGSLANSGAPPTTLQYDLMQLGTAVTGTWSTSDAGEGSVDATLVGQGLNPFILNETTPGCAGRFSGTATINGDSMTFSYAGSDCDGYFSAHGTAERIHFCSGTVQSNCCGNNQRDGSDECDGTDTPTCQDLGFAGGQTSCQDCRLDRSGCFNAGTCNVGGACDDSCFIVCPDGSFNQVCINSQCVQGSCVCSGDPFGCCQLAGVPMSNARSVRRR